MSDLNDRTHVRRSEIRDGRKANVTATLFRRDEATGATGEHLKAMRSYEAKALDDPFVNLYSVGSGSMAILAPDFPPYSLIKLPNESSTLRQCVDAMVTNIDSFGYRLEYIGERGEEDSDAAVAERDRVQSLLEQPNGEYTVVELRERVRRDLETFGYGFMEVCRDIKNEICLLNHVPAHTMRMTATQSELVPVQQFTKRDGRLVKIRTRRRFRRFIQQVATRLVYFKEFGDPRKIDPTTGLENNALTVDLEATEIFHFSLYSPGSPYGIPRYVNNLPAIMGTRESELTNLQFFKDNAIPAMAIMVSGGALTGDTIANIENHFTTARGRGSMNRVVVLEATGDDNAAKVDGQVPPPKMELKTLVSERQTDGLFASYEDANEKKIRASFRLPPLFVGRSDDYSRATADASMVMADAQVFGPERNREDEIWNASFLTVGGMPLRYWRMRTNPPRLVSADSILTAMSTLDDLGALTPNIAIGIANELFDLALTPITAAWGNHPFPLVMQLAMADNLKGLDDIMIVVEGIEHGRKLGTESQTTPDDQQSGAADAKPRKKAKQIERASNVIAYRFRQLAMRGNDLPEPMVTPTSRKRPREKLPKPYIVA